MTRKDRLIRWLPTLLGASFAVLGLGALGFASQGLRLSVAPAEEPSPTVDPIALLRDDVAALQRDLSGLSSDVGANLTAMAQALDDAAAARDEAQGAATAARLDALERRLAQLQAGQRALQSRLEAAPLTSPPAGAPPAAEPAAPEPAAPEPTAPEPAAAAPPPAAQKKPALFSFRSSGGLDLDERQRYQVIGSLSRVGFDAKSTLHDFSGVTSQVEGELQLRLADPGRDGEGEVSCQAATLLTGVEGRDEEMRKRLETERFPQLRFQMRDFQVGALDRAALTVTGTVSGDMTIHGVTRPLTVPVRVAVDPSKRVVLEGEAQVRMSEFGVEPPTVGPITVEDQVKLWFSLRLRALGRAEPAK